MNKADVAHCKGELLMREAGTRWGMRGKDVRTTVADAKAPFRSAGQHLPMA